MSGNRGKLFRSLEIMFASREVLLAFREALFGSLETLYRCLDALFFCLDGIFATTYAISTAKRPRPPKPPHPPPFRRLSPPRQRSGASADRRQLPLLGPRMRRSTETPLRLPTPSANRAKRSICGRSTLSSSVEERAG